MPNGIAILLAAGSGSRMRGATDDKILMPIAGIPVISRSADAFLESGVINRIVIVYRDAEQQQQLESVIVPRIPDSVSVSWVAGGRERQDSVFAALQLISDETASVFIHDAARPLLEADVVRELDGLVSQFGAACLAHRVTDTIKQASESDSNPRPRHLETLDRSLLWAMETPQAFRADLIREAYDAVIQKTIHVTDDAAAVERLGHPVVLLENPEANPKLTRPSDIAWIEYLLSRRPTAPNHADD